MLPDFTFEHAWQLLLTAAGAVLGWLHVARRDEIAEMKRQIAAAQDSADEAKESAVALAFKAGEALSKHQLYAAETFPRKDEVERAVEKVEKRLSEQLNAHAESTLERLAEIRDRLPRRN